jgi:DNA polymerase delta subunit 1
MIPPIRILCFDIECNNDGTFPSPEKDEVIQIGTVLKVGNTIIQKAIFTLGGCADIPDSAVHSYSRERDMLMGWHDYFMAFDPDVITGYNILNFDWDYVMRRAEHLKIREFPFFDRIKN